MIWAVGMGNGENELFFTFRWWWRKLWPEMNCPWYIWCDDCDLSSRTSYKIWNNMGRRKMRVKTTTIMIHGRTELIMSVLTVSSVLILRFFCWPRWSWCWYDDVSNDVVVVVCLSLVGTMGVTFHYLNLEKKNLCRTKPRSSSSSTEYC